MKSLNNDLGIIYNRNSTSSERLMPSVHVGSFTVSTAANIAGGIQLARGISAFSRTGTGSSEYAVEGTQKLINLDKGDTLYRVFGGGAEIKGTWAFTKNPGNQITAISKGALPPENAAKSLTKITFTGSVEGESSIVNGMFGQPGGFQQVHLPWGHPNVVFSQATNLPIGLMPVIPQSLILDLINGGN